MTSTSTAARRKVGLSGVARVRAVRERDSRNGLATALAEEQHVAVRVRHLEQQLRELAEIGTVVITDFHARQQTLDALRNDLAAARHQLESARQVSLAARQRWLTDRSRLDAVEVLIERRLSALRVERRRREDREQDEIATDLWRRHHAPVNGGPS